MFHGRNLRRAPFVLDMNIVRRGAKKNVVLIQFLWTVGATVRIFNFIQILSTRM